jgi:hypothetical protein
VFDVDAFCGHSFFPAFRCKRKRTVAGAFDRRDCSAALRPVLDGCGWSSGGLALSQGLGRGVLRIVRVAHTRRASGDATPATSGTRVASFFWIQSMVREDAQRSLLFDLDMAIVRLTREHPGDPALVGLVGVYHNLLRMWAEP